MVWVQVLLEGLPMGLLVVVMGTTVGFVQGGGVNVGVGKPGHAA
jgi:hypothetical protein